MFLEFEKKENEMEPGTLPSIRKGNSSTVIHPRKIGYKAHLKKNKNTREEKRDLFPSRG